MMVMRYVDDHDIMTLAAPFIIALPFFLIWAFSKGKAMGFGDIVMFFGVGAFFGLVQGGAVVLVSTWTGAVFGVVLYFLKKKSERKNMIIPFVPFIVFAFLFVLFTDIDVFSIASLFA
jgi:prepilin signal peptidase PulO-like enzyme (type II secretory pathway)